MIRKLAIIAGAGLVLSIACIAGAAALGGADLRRHGWTWVVTDDTPGDSSFRIRREEPGPDISRTLAWAGGDRLTVDLPGEVTYVPGAQAGVSITGPQRVVNRVRIVDGRLTMEDDRDGERGHINWDHQGISVWSETERLRITVTAPSVKTFVVDGSGDLTIRDYDQETMDVSISGSGDVSASGETRTLRVEIDGSGAADLSDLRTTDVDVDIAGSGAVEVAPTGAATVAISGSGEVDLLTRPASLRTDISGSGEVNEHG